MPLGECTEFAIAEGAISHVVSSICAKVWFALVYLKPKRGQEVREGVKKYIVSCDGGARPA